MISGFGLFALPSWRWFLAAAPITASDAVTGTDTDPGRGLTFNVVGVINPQGQLTSTATASDAAGASSLNGQLQLETSNRLTGTLVWGTQPPASYRYVLSH